MPDLLLQFFRKVLPPPFKNFLKRSLFALRRLTRMAWSRPNVILCYPELPGGWYAISKICHVLGCKITNDPKEKFDVAFHWQNRTIRTADDWMLDLASRSKVFNIRCNDISKKHVDAVFKEVFGYSTLVNPSTHQGVCVEKSDLNAQHDGRIVECPLDYMKPECVYQKLIDNRWDEKLVRDFRVPIIGGGIPLVYLKYKLINDRFGLSIKGEVVERDEILSGEEADKIFLFCKNMGMDFGELDVLRDNADGKLYIVDANNTPLTRSVGMKEKDTRNSLKRVAKAFEKVFL